MKPLYAKEIRLLQPAYLMALLLAVVPVWLLPRRQPYDFPESTALVAFLFGVVMLALSVFGREFGLQTFPLLLAQPVERRRIWWTKSGLLAAAMLTVFLAWWASCSVCLRTVSRDFNSSDTLIVSVVGVVVAFAGGLWTTLLLRQMSGAFWFTILVPAMIAALLSQARPWLGLLALGLYAAAGFWWARHQFLGAQDTAWTGGVIAFPGWRGAQTTLGARKHRPWTALFWKELQLQQVGLMGMAWLFLMHLGVLGLRRVNYAAFGETLRTVLEVFGGVWIAVPLLVSAVSVAEERKLGTLAQHLTLPVSRRAQFGMKLLLTLGIGGFLSALLVCAVEGIGNALGTGHGMFGPRISPADVAMLFLLFIGFAFIGFYASTLARNVVQAVATAVVGTLAICFFGVIAPQPGPILHLWVWQGFLIYYLAWPALFAALWWLAWRNFRSESGSDHLWRRNALVLGSVLAGVMLLTCAIYNRVWELLTPTDPRPGTARIMGANPVIMRSLGGTALTAILPDGRLWVDRISYHPGNAVLGFGERAGFWTGGKWTSLSGNQIVAGPNWASALANFRETVAIASDGTLWISEKPRRRPDRDTERPRFEEAASLTRFGSETNWQDVVQEYYPWSVALLKKDGTLWRLGTNSASERNARPGLRSFTPQRLVSESGWNRILAGEELIYAWKSDGSAWALHPPERRDAGKENEMGVVLERVPPLDHTQWRALARFSEHQVGVREDGTLWAWPTERLLIRKGGFDTLRIVRISPDSDWAVVAGEYESLALRKTDGSVWRWTFPGWDSRAHPFLKPPVRLGMRHDWAAVASTWDGVLSLAADGNLYYWWDPGRQPYGGNSDQPMLAPPRKPSLVENIFGGQGHQND